MKRRISMMIPGVKVDLGRVAENIFDHWVLGALNRQVNRRGLRALRWGVKGLGAGNSASRGACDREGGCTPVGWQQGRECIQVACSRTSDS